MKCSKWNKTIWKSVQSREIQFWKVFVVEKYNFEKCSKWKETILKSVQSRKKEKFWKVFKVLAKTVGPKKVWKLIYISYWRLVTNSAIQIWKHPLITCFIRAWLQLNVVFEDNSLANPRRIARFTSKPPFPVKNSAS